MRRGPQRLQSNKGPCPNAAGSPAISMLKRPLPSCSGGAGDPTTKEVPQGTREVQPGLGSASLCQRRCSRGLRQTRMAFASCSDYPPFTRPIPVPCSALASTRTVLSPTQTNQHICLMRGEGARGREETAVIGASIHHHWCIPHTHCM